MYIQLFIIVVFIGFITILVAIKLDEIEHRLSKLENKKRGRK